MNITAQFVPASPHVASITINGGDLQRSLIDRLQITFSSGVIVADWNAALRLVDRGSGQAVDISAAVIVHTAGETVAELRLDQVPLADGSYELQLLADGILSPIGQALDVDEDGLPDGGQGLYRAVTFHRLAGDLDGDASVTAADVAAVREMVGQASGDVGYKAGADLNGDGMVTARDMQLARQRMGREVSMP